MSNKIQDFDDDDNGDQQGATIAPKRNYSHKKVALVTGSSTGIGANIAVDLAKAGYRVIVTGRSIDKLAKIVQLCEEVSGAESSSAIDKSDQDNDENFAAFPFIADLFDLKQVDLLVDFIRTKFNRLDVLVNNACWRGNVKNILDENAYDDMKKVMHINLSAPMYLINKCLIPVEGEKYPWVGHSLIVINISSIASQIVVPLHLYSISKACLSELTRQLALKSIELGILSVTVSPGPILTEERPHHKNMSPLTLMNRVGSTQEISNLVMFAIEHAHLFNGKELNIDGGYIAQQK